MNYKMKNQNTKNIDNLSSSIEQILKRFKISVGRAVNDNIIEEDESEIRVKIDQTYEDNNYILYIYHNGCVPSVNNMKELLKKQDAKSEWVYAPFAFVNHSYNIRYLSRDQISYNIKVFNDGEISISKIHQEKEYGVMLCLTINEYDASIVKIGKEIRDQLKDIKCISNLKYQICSKETKILKRYNTN